MSYDGGRDPLDITQVIEFVPDDSGVVSDREFDQDDLLPNVEEEQAQATTMSETQAPQGERGTSAAESVATAQSRAAAGTGIGMGAAADGVDLQEPPAYGADGGGSIRHIGILERRPEDPSESGRGIIPPLPSFASQGASAPGSGQDSVWGGISGVHQGQSVQNQHYSAASSSKYGNAAWHNLQGSAMDPSGLEGHNFSGTASVGGFSQGGIPFGNVPHQVNFGTPGVGAIPSGGGVPSYGPGFAGAAAPYQVPQGHGHQVGMGQQFPQGPTDNRLLFSAVANVTDAEISQTQGVLVSKDNRQPGTKEFGYHMKAAIAGISPKLGVPNYYISSAEGEADDGNETQERYLQDQFAQDIAKIDNIDSRMHQYDLKRPFLISSLKTLDLNTTNNLLDLWNDDQADMLESHEKITWRQVCLWQLTLNRKVPVGSADRTSMDWALMLLYNSCTKDLRDQIDLKYDHLPTYYKGAVVYLYIILQCLFKTSRDQIQSLKKFLKIFAKNGLRKYPGESVVKAKIPLMAACKRLYAVGQLDDDATNDVLSAFVKCSVPKFVTVFSLMQQECTRAGIMPGGPRIWGHQTIMDEVTYVVALAVEHFGNINTVHEWNVPKGKGAHAAIGSPVDQTCWNCGKPNCKPSTCPEPKDEARIAKNRKEYFEKKQQRSGGSTTGRGGSGRGGGRSGGRGGNGGRGRGGRGSNEQYSREKWGAPSGANAVVWHDGVPHSYCAACRKGDIGNRNGWNTTHSTKFHAAAQKEGFSVLGTLAAASPDHPLVAAVRSNGRTGSTVGIPDLGATSSGSSLTGVSREHSIQIFRQFSTMAKNDDERKIVEDLQSALALK
jgi:uncharacterized membrane protein YgcG